MTAILRYTAFTDTPPAATRPAWSSTRARSATRAMQEIAAELGYSRDRVRDRARGRRLRRPLLQPRGRGAVLRARDDRHRRRARRARRPGPAQLPHAGRRGAGATPAAANGAVTATLTSVVPHVEDVPADVLDAGARRAALERGRARPRAPAADRLRRRAPPDHQRRHARPPEPPRLRLRRAQAADAGQRPDDGRPRAPRGRARPSTRATRSRSAASSRTPRPARPPRPSAPTCARPGASRRRRRSRSTRASTWAARAC